MLKNQLVFNDFTGSRVRWNINFWMKKQWKEDAECRHRVWIDFRSIFGTVLEPESFQNRFRGGLGRALNRTSISNHALSLKKCANDVGGVFVCKRAGVHPTIRGRLLWMTPPPITASLSGDRNSLQKVYLFILRIEIGADLVNFASRGEGSTPP